MERFLKQLSEMWIASQAGNATLNAPLGSNGPPIEGRDLSSIERNLQDTIAKLYEKVSDHSPVHNPTENEIKLTIECADKTKRLRQPPWGPIQGV